MYGALLNSYVTPGVGVLGAVQRDQPDRLRDLLISRQKLYGYDDLAKAVLCAAENGYDECLSVLLRHNVSPDVHDGCGITALQLAAKRGHHNVLTLLVEYSANVNRANHRVRATALHWAATNGHEGCVDILLDAGAKVEAQTSNGRTPLMLAARCGSHDIVQTLIEAGARPDTCDFERCTALHLAAEEGHLDTCQLLVTSGAQVNARMKHGDSPLLMALKQVRHTSVAQYLLSLPNISATSSSHGLSALHWTAHYGHTDCLAAILPHYISLDVTTAATYYGPHNVVQAGVTPLMLSCSQGHLDATRLLLRHGASTAIADVEGMVPLFYAIRRDQGEAVAALIRSGADPNQRQPEAREDDEARELYESSDEEEGFPQAAALTPLFMCIERNSLQSFLALLAGGCNLSTVYLASHGQLLEPLEFCLQKGRVAMCQMLLTLGRVFQVRLTPAVQHAMSNLLQTDEEGFSSILAMLSAPPLLAQQSRWRVRLSMKNLDDVHLLPVPDSIKRYLELGDVAEYVNTPKETDE